MMKGKRHVGFRVATYDPSRPLIIDPVLAYSTYLGGSDTDRGNSIAVDSAGSAYVTGDTASIDFPTTAGAAQTTSAGFDAFISKLNATGTALVYSTYLGGSDSDHSFSIAVDGTGSAYVTGETRSPDFPTTAGAVQTTLVAGVDAFVTRLNATGSVLDYSTYLLSGGSGLGIAVDGAGAAYVTGATEARYFPTTPGALQPTHAGGFHDAFVTKLNATGTVRLYSTYLGGGSGAQDIGGDIAVDSAGSAYVTGRTDSTDFPITPGAAQTTLSDRDDAFVSKLNATGTALVYSTYLGGSDYEDGVGIAVDAAGSAYVTAATQSTDFPTTSGVVQASHAGGRRDAVVTKLNATGTALVYSTYLGGSGDDLVVGLAVDGAGAAFVSGTTESTDFPTTSAAPQTTYAGGISDTFVTKLNATGSSLVYSTYLGGSSLDFSGGLAVDGAGTAYVTGQTFSTDFPTTAGAAQATHAGGLDAFVTKIASLPTSIDECKNGGWKTFGVLKNQGDCVSFVATKGKNPPSLP